MSSTVISARSLSTGVPLTERPAAVRECARVCAAPATRSPLPARHVRSARAASRSRFGESVSGVELVREVVEGAHERLAEVVRAAELRSRVRAVRAPPRAGPRAASRRCFVFSACDEDVREDERLGDLERALDPLACATSVLGEERSAAGRAPRPAPRARAPGSSSASAANASSMRSAPPARSPDEPHREAQRASDVRDPLRPRPRRDRARSPARNARAPPDSALLPAPRARLVRAAPPARAALRRALAAFSK